MRRKIQLNKKSIIFVIFFTFSLLINPFIILSTNSSEINLRNNSEEIIFGNNSAERGGVNEQIQSQNISPPKPNTQKGNVFRKDWNWTGWYNGSVDPTSEGWTLVETMDGQGAQWDQYNGILNISTLGESGKQWFYYKPVNFDSSKGYTINFRMQVNDPAPTIVDRTFQWMDGQINQTLSFQRDKLNLYPGSLSEGNYNYNMITDDKYHDYWICSKNNFTRVWIDNINVWNFTSNASTSLNRIAFGDVNPGANGSETLWNYIRWYEEGEIVPWHETGVLWYECDDGSLLRECRNDFDYIYFLTQTMDRAVTWKHPIIVENDCYERQAIVSNGGGGRVTWRDYAFAELAINDKIFNWFIGNFCAIADLFKNSSGLRAFVIGDELPGSYFNTYMERFVLYDTPSFNFTKLNKTDEGKLKIAEWATEKNTEALNRIYYYMKEYLDGYDIEIYQAAHKYTDISSANHLGIYNAVNFSKVIGDGYGSNCYLSNQVLDNWQFLINEKLFFLNRYATLYPNKPHFMFIEGSEFYGLLSPEKTILEKGLLELCSVPGNIHIAFFTACVWLGDSGWRKCMVNEREHDNWKPIYEDMWNLIREASSFCRSQPLLRRNPQDIVYVIPHYQKYCNPNRFLYQSPAFWIPRTINYDIYSTKEILNNFNEKPINDYALVIISCCWVLDQEELDLIRSWDETWKIWMCRAGYFTENNTERGLQSFWDISNRKWKAGFHLNIDATGIGMSFDYKINSTGHFGHFGNCSFDANGKSLVSLYNDEKTFHLLVKYTDDKGFGEYWLGNYLFFWYNDQCDDLFSAIIEWCLKDRGFYPTEQKFSPNRFTLSSDADNPDGDGRFTLKWVESLFADNYSVYTSESYITEITDDLTLIGDQEADQPYFSTKNLSTNAGIYYFIVEAHNKYGSTISNCIKINISVSDKNINIITPENKTYTAPMSGYYPATFGFENDADGTVPKGWDARSLAGIQALVLDEIGGHKKVVKLDDQSVVNGNWLNRSFSPQTNGTVEFYLRTVDATKETAFRFRNEYSGLYSLFILKIESDKFQYYNGIWNDVGKAALDNTWYHIRIDIECSGSGYQGLAQYRWQLEIDGTQYGPYTFDNDENQFNNVIFSTETSVSNIVSYVDAFGESWDPNYNVGDNKEEGLLLSFTSDITLDWMGYSLDGQAIRTILGNTTFPMPDVGLHTIQVFGKDSLGTMYLSDVRYFTITYIFEELYHGFGMARINGQRFFGAATLSLSEDTVQMEIDDQIITWDVVRHFELRYMEIYKAEGELGRIRVIVIRCGSSTYVIAVGTGVLFLGST